MQGAGLAATAKAELVRPSTHVIGAGRATGQSNTVAAPTITRCADTCSSAYTWLHPFGVAMTTGLAHHKLTAAPSQLPQLAAQLAPRARGNGHQL